VADRTSSLGLYLTSVLGSRIFFGTPLKPSTMLGAVLGIGGVVLVFLPEISNGAGKGNPALGIAFALGGALTASLGNIVAYRNHGPGLPVVQMNTLSQNLISEPRSTTVEVLDSLCAVRICP